MIIAIFSSRFIKTKTKFVDEPPMTLAGDQPKWYVMGDLSVLMQSIRRIRYLVK